VPSAAFILPGASSLLSVVEITFAFAFLSSSPAAPTWFSDWGSFFFATLIVLTNPSSEVTPWFVLFSTTLLISTSPFTICDSLSCSVNLLKPGLPDPGLPSTFTLSFGSFGVGGLGTNLPNNSWSLTPSLIISVAFNLFCLENSARSLGDMALILFLSSIPALILLSKPA